MNRKNLPSLVRLLLALVCMAAAALLLAGPASAADEEPATDSGIDVVQVNGLIDPSNAALIKKVVHEAEAEGSSIVIVQLDGTGAVDVDVEELAQVIEDATIPVGVWVGPS